MLYLIALILVSASYIEAREFHNPILSDKSYVYPSAIKVNGTFYVVAHTYEPIDGVFPIHTSTDLDEWKPAGFIFDENNIPEWTRTDTMFFPKIHQIGSKFLVYFSAANTTSGHVHVGVATASHPLGPYTSSNEALVALPNEYSLYATVINDQENLYLVWSNSSKEIKARQLDSTGLAFSSDETTTLLTPILAWEKGYLYNPWYIQRGGYHYLLFDGGETCSSYLVGVARSRNALGPYEEFPYPMVVSNERYGCLRDLNVVKDLDDKSDIVVFNGFRIDDPDRQQLILLSSLIWDVDDWPHVEDF